MNIMIVDDNFTIRKGTKHAVANFFSEHKVYEAASAEEAIGIMETTPMHIVLTDIIMPGMDGLTFIDTYRNRFLNTHWVVMTALSSHSFVRKAMELGVNDYLLKPFNKLELFKTLDTLIHSTESC